MKCSFLPRLGSAYRFSRGVLINTALSGNYRCGPAGCSDEPRLNPSVVGRWAVRRRLIARGSGPGHQRELCPDAVMRTSSGTAQWTGEAVPREHSEVMWTSKTTICG